MIKPNVLILSFIQKILVIVSLLAPMANASLIVFDYDRFAWEAATSNMKVIDFEDREGHYHSYTHPFGVTFQSNYLIGQSPSYSIGSWNALISFGGELTINLPEPVTSFGFEWKGGSYDHTLLDVIVDGRWLMWDWTFNSSTIPAKFFGFTSDYAFSSVSLKAFGWLSGSRDYFRLDNFAFGDRYIAPPPPELSPVPEPSSIALFGLAGAFFMMTRKRTGLMQHLRHI